MACYDSTENNIEITNLTPGCATDLYKRAEVTHLSLVYFRQNTKQSFHIPHKQYLNI